MVIFSLVCATEVLFCPAGFIPDTHAGIPDHELKYEDKLSPAWKGTWDMARQFYREHKYREALVQYEILLAQKEDVAEARWEYTSILLGLKRWHHAGQQLELLLGLDPENRQYRIAAASVSLESGKGAEAVELYRQLFASDPDGPESTTALEGLVRALEGSGFTAELVPFMEKLAARKPAEKELQRKLAVMMLEAGRFDEARGILNRLEGLSVEDAAVIDQQARVHTKADDQEGAARYWQMLVARDKDNLEANRMLQEYYAGRGDWDMSLKHLEVVLRVTPDDPVLLKQAAGINLQLGRVDAALAYYESGLALEPENLNLRNSKRVAQRVMAGNLLPLVENGGSQKLWQDLEQVTPDRTGVFREIASLLREQGRTEELVDVLALLYREDPRYLPAYQELAFLLTRAGRGGELKHLQRQTTGKDADAAE